MYSCKACSFTTDRKDSYVRHEKSRKHKKNMNDIEHMIIANSDSQLEDNKNQASCILQCEKCKEVYKSKRRLDEHILKCKGIDSLTCPRCMKSFTHRANKSKHVKRGNCKPVSIFEYLKRKNITNVSHIDNLTVNNNYSITNNNMNTNIYINNYGNERMDYLSFNDFMKLIKCCNNSIIPKYIKIKHFNPMFPENHNIKYKNNIFFIKRNDDWEIVNSTLLSKRLYNDGGSEVYYYSTVYDDKIKDTITNDNDYEDTKIKTNYVELEAKGHDCDIKRQIIDTVKTCNKDDVQIGNSIPACL